MSARIERDRSGRMSSVQAAELITTNLSRHMRDLTEAGKAPLQRGGRLVHHYAGHVITDAADDTPAQEVATRQWEDTPQVETAELRRAVKNDHPSYGLVSFRLAPRLSRTVATRAPWRADTQVTRVLFMPPHDEAESQRVVVDSWLLPKTKLTEAPYKSEADREAYGELHANLFKRTGHPGVPLAAEDVEHLVLGRPRTMLNSVAFRKVMYVVHAFGAAFQNEIAWQKQQSVAG